MYPYTKDKLIHGKADSSSTRKLFTQIRCYTFFVFHYWDPNTFLQKSTQLVAEFDLYLFGCCCISSNLRHKVGYKCFLSNFKRRFFCKVYFVVSRGTSDLRSTICHDNFIIYTMAIQAEFQQTIQNSKSFGILNRFCTDSCILK